MRGMSAVGFAFDHDSVLVCHGSGISASQTWDVHGHPPRAPCKEPVHRPRPRASPSRRTRRAREVGPHPGRASKSFPLGGDARIRKSKRTACETKNRLLRCLKVSRMANGLKWPSIFAFS
jgi:hypothetical protein